MATLMIISGPSALGKSTLAHKLSRDLKLPLLLRDVIKEALYDGLGYSDRQRSIELGGAAALIMHCQTMELLDAGRRLMHHRSQI